MDWLGVYVIPPEPCRATAPVAVPDQTGQAGRPPYKSPNPAKPATPLDTRAISRQNLWSWAKARACYR